MKFLWNVDTIVDNDGILWLNDNHIEERLDHESLRLTTVKYLAGYRKHTYELVDEPKNNQTKLLYAKN